MLPPVLDPVRCRVRRPLPTSSGLLGAALLLVACSGGGSEPPRATAPPQVAALDAIASSPVVHGRVLLGELGCVACHDAAGSGIEFAAGPDLGTAGSRIEASYLRAFVTSPHDREPGTVIPDLLRRWRGAELRERADELTHYVRSFAPPGTGELPAPTAVDPAAAERGRALYERIGCRACHGDQPSPHLREKYRDGALAAFLLAPHEARPARRMPDFALSPAEAHDLAQWLGGPAGGPASGPAGGPASGPAGGPAGATAHVDPGQVARGRDLFAELRCANCHALPDAQRRPPPAAPPLAALDPTRGCLSGTVGPWPHYALTDVQQASIRAALAGSDAPLAAGPRLLQLLASRRCLACHRRDDVDAAAGRGHDLFGTDDASLGEEGRLPPTLTGVGARLQPAWLERTIAHGQRERPYLHTRMPGFGDDYARTLAAALAAADTLPPIEITPLPDDGQAAHAVLELGRELVGDRGMSCITCHRFGGEQAGTMGAIDLVHTTGERLRPEWFAHFLRDPFRFKPNTLMPHYFPGGKSTRPQLAGGDAQRQIDAIWHYLAAGRNGRRPSGLRQPPIELTVGDEAVMLRRAVQGAGKRGISVGYPGGVNSTFDAEELGLNQLWWGRFVDARPVWTSQGSGQAQILSREVFSLPNGPAFVGLDRPDAPWPTATRRERGDRWLGYTLDDDRRPTFRYTAGDVTILDASREVVVDGAPPRLRRTLTLAGGKAELYFRVAVHEDLRLLDAQTAAVGPRLCIRCDGAAATVATIAGEDRRELRVRVAVDEQPVEFTVEYFCQQGDRR
jgi:hypothetical protein